MRIPRVYHAGATAAGQIVELGDAAARHVTKVLRLQAGAPLIVFDGRGRAFDARLEAGKPPRARLEAVLASKSVPTPEIELLQGVSRGTRMDFVVQKATELGATSIVPVIAARSVVRLDGAGAERKRAHWETIAINACEQCGRNHLPAIRTPLPLMDAIDRNSRDSFNVLLDTDGTVALPAADAAPARARLLIGPEGGFTEVERDAALAHGFVAVRLGPRVLRTETAAVTGLAVLQYRWGDLGSNAVQPGDNRQA